MNERGFTTAAHRALHQGLGGHVEITKHSDRFTSDIPDSSIAWHGNTTWVEFKRLGPTETIHDQIRLGQVLKLIALSKGCGLAWAVAYRLGNSRHPATTEIYHPRFLLSATGEPLVPVQTAPPPVWFHHHLLKHGVAVFEGHRHDALVALVKETHL